MDKPGLSRPLFTGKHHQYHWAEWPEEFLSSLLSSVPELVVGRRLVVTSFDSGFLQLNEADYERGWSKLGYLAISPPITNLNEVPFGEYDEWYVFDSPPELMSFDKLEVFINYGKFSLQDPENSEVQKRFWQQLEQIHPEIYLAEGGHLFLVTASSDLYEKAVRWSNSVS